MNVSVVICTYNRALSLRLTLDALHAQVTPPDVVWELLVIDNNSSDDTRGTVQTFVATTRMQVRYYFVAQQGLSHTRNAGVTHARGELVAFTDDDVTPAPDWVASIVAAMGQADVHILGGCIRPAWDEPPPPWLDARPFLRGHLALIEHETPAQVVSLRQIPTVWGANMAFRRDVFAGVGLFDTRRGMRGAKPYRGEDSELVGRALAAGYRIAYDPHVVVWHRIRASRMRVSYFARVQFRWGEGKALTQTPLQGYGFLGVPLSSYRWMARRVVSLVWAAVRLPPRTLDLWLGFCERAGLIGGSWKRHVGTGSIAPRR